MTRGAYLGSFAVGTVGAWSAFAATAGVMTPAQGRVALLAFFGTLALAVAGTAIVFLTALYCRGAHDTLHRRIQALRHGLELTAVVMALLALQWWRVLTWYTALVPVGVVLLWEARYGVRALCATSR